MSPPAARMRSTRLGGVLTLSAVMLFFAASGACGLLYQVIWTRRLVLLLGATSYGVSTVLSIFFLGLACGSLWGGRFADRVRAPLRWYGLFEIGIGLWAVLFIAAIGPAEAVLVPAFREWAGHRMGGVALRAGAAFALLIAPVTLMGATLPLLARFATRRSDRIGLRIGLLYALNTLGAVAGCLLAGFAVLPALGYTRATLLGAVVNVLTGAGALLVSAWTRERDLPASMPEAAAADVDAVPRRWVVAGAFAVSGCAALALEVLWTRLLALLFLGTTYAFTTMLATLLCGLALGSAAAAPLAKRQRGSTLALGLAEIAAGCACLITLPWWADLPEWFAAVKLAAGYDWTRIALARFGLSAAVLFPPTFLFGMTFPFAVRAYTGPGQGLGRDVGRLYAANTLGGVLGAALGGFVLIPRLGTHWGIQVAALGPFIAGAALLLFGARPRPAWARAAAIAALPAWFALSAFAQPRLADVGVAVAEAAIPEGHCRLHYREGVEATVAVSAPPGAAPGTDRTLWINAVQATASIEKGVKMNRLQGVLPMLFDREPKRVLFMCFGSGITCGTLGLWDFERIDAVEISPEVLEAAPLFAHDNFDVMRNPKVQFIIDDGRNFLLTTAERYDVITFEPMPLALQGVSMFYTREYYALCRSRLAPAGLVSQWVPLHSLDPLMVRSLVQTFVEVFPKSCAFFINADLFLIGSDARLRMPYARVAERLAQPRIAQALAEAGLPDAVEVLTCFFMGPRDLAQYAQGGRIMTDDRPWAEFAAPKAVHARTVHATLGDVAPHYASPVSLLDFAGLDPGQAEAVQARIARRVQAKRNDLVGLKLYYGGSPLDAPEQVFAASLELDPDDANARYYLRKILEARVALFVRWEEFAEGEALLTDLLERLPAEPAVHLALGDLYHAWDRLPAARGHYRFYLALGGQAPRAQARALEGP